MSATYGLYPNLDKPEATRISHELLGWLEQRGFRVLVPPAAATFLQREDLAREVGQWEESQAVLVLGGDGTLLNAAKQVAPFGVPVLGINLGRLGFLTELELDELYQELPALLRGEGMVEERMLLEAVLVRGGEAATPLLAMNDVVVAKGPFARLVHLEVRVNDFPVATYPADGIIVATATGSTAYSLSAGGPVISPAVEVLEVTPICPHTLQARSLVVGRDDRVSLRLLGNPPETLLTVDGQWGQQVQAGDRVEVARSSFPARLLRRHSWNFYAVLQRKLQEAGGGWRG